MARTKSEFLKSFGTAFEVWKSIVDEVLANGGSDNDLRSLIGDRDRLTAIAKIVVGSDFANAPVGHLVTVDRSFTYPQMIEAGSYDNYEDAVSWITEEHFPVDRTGKLREDKELFLVPPSRDGLTTTEWKAELEANGWELERAPELLALGAKYPNLQREFYIVAFGSSWRSPFGDLYSPALWSDDGERGADARWCDPGHRWSLHDRALVSRKRR